MNITLQGLEDAQVQLARIQRGVASLATYEGIVGTRQPYGWGMEYGQFEKTPRLARRSGGAYYLTGAVEQVLAEADHDLTEGLDHVTAPGKWVLKRLALWARRLARLSVPRDTGLLRRRIIAEVRAKG